MSYRKVFYCFLLLIATLIFPNKSIGQNNLFLDDYTFAGVDAGKDLKSAIDSGCTSFVFDLLQEGDSFYLENSSNKNLFQQKLDSISKITDEAIVVLKGNYKQQALKEYLTTLEIDIFIGEWEQWPLLTTFQKEKNHTTIFLEHQLTIALTESMKRNSSNLEQILNESLNKLVVFEPSFKEIDSLTSICFKQWNATGKVPNFIVVDSKYVSQAKKTINTLNQTRRFKGELKFQDSFLNKIYWKQLPGTVTPGKFSFPHQEGSTILSPYKNGFKITPGEIIHNAAMKDIPRLFSAYESTMEDKLDYYFKFEKNTGNQVEKDWENTISKGANWIKDDERNYVVHFKHSNSFIDYSKENTLNFNTPISVSAWVKPDSLMEYMGIMGFGKAFSLKLRRGKPDFTTATIKDHMVDSTFEINNWYHVGFVFTPGATVDFFINGEKIKSMLASEILPSKQSLIIGNNIWGEQYYGAVDDLMIWDRGLSEKEFLELYKDQLSPKSKFFQNKIALFGGGAILFLLLLLLFKRKRAKNNKQLVSFTSRGNQSADKNFPNKIEILGTFNIVSEKKGNISKLFSPLLKQLLSFFIINTVYFENGITSKKINDTFWPGFTKIQAKENRGTNIQKLRKLLEYLPGANIVFRDKKWFFECTGETYADLFQYANLKNLLSYQLDSGSVNINDLKAFLSVLKNGNILQNIDSEWLDETKNKISYEVNTLLSQLYSEEIKENSLKISMARTMFLFDDLNEEALKIMVNELIKNGNHGQAKQAYEEFARRYLALYNEPFPKDYNSL